MTTTAATDSASTSLSNDSRIQDNNGASEPTTEITTTTSSSTTTTTTTTITTTTTNTNTNTNTNASTDTTASAPPSTISDHQLRQPQPQKQQSSKQQPQQQANNSAQKRPMNAFLLFCKTQRSTVREQYPNLENRGITKILGDYWSKLDKEQKSKYTDLARQHKEAFMEANPDFKWCKTHMNSSSSNNNNNNSTSSNSNSNDCYATTSNGHTESSRPAHADNIQPTNCGDASTNRQQEAPKPPKKRFLERNDTNHHTMNKSVTNNETNTQPKDGLVPFISLDQDTLDRVIDEAFSEKSNNSPSSGPDMCKCSNRISISLAPSSRGVNTGCFTTASSAPSSSSSPFSSNVDEPVDFSMNRTFNATGQQIINNLVERMLSGPTDNVGGTSNMTGR